MLVRLDVPGSINRSKAILILLCDGEIRRVNASWKWRFLDCGMAKHGTDIAFSIGVDERMSSSSIADRGHGRLRIGIDEPERLWV